MYLILLTKTSGQQRHSALGPHQPALLLSDLHTTCILKARNNCHAVSKCVICKACFIVYSHCMTYVSVRYVVPSKYTQSHNGLSLAPAMSSPPIPALSLQNNTRHKSWHKLIHQTRATRVKGGVYFEVQDSMIQEK